MSSSYLDLSPLYGSSQEQQNLIRTFKNGGLTPDTFIDGRLHAFPPGVAALMVCFNRFHNYVVQQLANINEGGRFVVPDLTAITRTIISTNSGTMTENEMGTETRKT